MSKASKLGIGIIRRGKENYIQMKFNNERIEFHTYPVLQSIDKILGYRDGEVMTLCTFSNFKDPVEEGFAFTDYLTRFGYKNVDEIANSITEVYMLPEERRADFHAL